ncbi:MAG: hypothetical protein AAF570_23525, partial [Bacteroidota bacterium]
ETQEFHPNGKVRGKGKGTLKDREGKWEFWHLNGQKMMIGEYKSGKKVGLHQAWNDKTQLTSEEVWNADGSKRESWKVIFYHGNGKKQSEGLLDEEGRKKGLWKHWYANGNKKKEANWEMACDGGGGRPFAVDYKEWDESEKLTSKGNETDMQQFTYFPDGSEMEVTTVQYVNRDPCKAQPVDVFEDGRLKRKVVAAQYDRFIVLEKVTFYETGDTMTVDRWDVDGKRHGNQEGWYNDGKKHYLYHYRNGGVQGTVKEWYPGGLPMLDHKYKSAEGGPAKLVEGTYYNEKGKDWFYSNTSGKDKKKQMIEIENTSRFTRFYTENH